MSAPTWSVVGSSTAFSAFAAVLAALMFAAMVLLLTREVQVDAKGSLVGVSTEAPAALENPLAFMFGSFFSLVVAAFLFAAIAGDENHLTQVKQFVEGSMPALVLSFGVVQMAVALSWLLVQRELFGIPLELSRYVVHATLIIAGFFLAGIMVSPLTWISSNFLGGPIATWLLLGFLIASSVVLGPATRRMVIMRIGLNRVVRYVNVSAVAIAIVCSVLWNLLSGLQDPQLEWLYQSPGGLALLAFGVIALAWFSALEVAVPSLHRPVRGDVRLGRTPKRVQSTSRN